MKVLSGLILAVFGGAAQAASAAAAAGPVVYVDCSAAAAVPQSGMVTRLEDLNRMHFKPGTKIYFKRGTTCHGSFQPSPGSSGKRGAPIVVGAYGDKSLPRPVIAAGCTDALADPRQERTEAAKTASGVSPYQSLCSADNPVVSAAAIHLKNVEYWEINSLELTNDALAEGGRVGLLVQLEDFGTGSHYRVNDVYVHHVRGYLQDEPGRAMPYKTTGGILFHVTRDGEAAGEKQKKTNFAGVLVENSEIYHVDGIGLATRSAWMCRPNGAPCGDYPPYKGKPDYLMEKSTQAAQEYFASTGIVFRNNKIHDVGGDGIVVRTAAGARIESNLLYDIWMRAPGNSAGAWAINTDDALFQYNEIHHTRMREQIEPGDGMAFDADMGTRRTRFIANYSHDNEGGMMLFCGCGEDGLGGYALASATLVERNLSVNDGRRIIAAAGTDGALIRANLVVNTKPGLLAPILENLQFAPRNAITLSGNTFVGTEGAPEKYRMKNPEASYADITWSANAFRSVAAQEAESLIARWIAESGFGKHRYKRRQ